MRKGKGLYFRYTHKNKFVGVFTLFTEPYFQEFPIRVEEEFDVAAKLEAILTDEINKSTKKAILRFYLGSKFKRCRRLVFRYMW